jgi:hypothetical protein
MQKYIQILHKSTKILRLINQETGGLFITVQQQFVF